VKQMVQLAGTSFAIPTAIMIVGPCAGLQGANRTGRTLTAIRRRLLYATLIDMAFAKGVYQRGLTTGDAGPVAGSATRWFACRAEQASPGGNQDLPSSCRRPRDHARLRATWRRPVAHESTLKALVFAALRRPFSHGRSTGPARSAFTTAIIVPLQHQYGVLTPKFSRVFAGCARIWLRTNSSSPGMASGGRRRFRSPMPPSRL